MNKQGHQSDDKWLNSLRHKMDGAEVPPPLEGWTRLESALDSPKRGIMLWSWLIPSAVAMLALVFLWNDGMLYTDDERRVNNEDTALFIDTPFVDSVMIAPTKGLSISKQSDRINYSIQRKVKNSATIISMDESRCSRIAMTEGVELAASDTLVKETGVKSSEQDSTSENNDGVPLTNIHPVHKHTNIYNDYPNIEKEHIRVCRLSLIASSGMISNQKTDVGGNTLASFNAMNIDTNEGKIYEEPESALLYRAEPEYAYDHDFPVKVGLGVTISFAERWAIETGLVYTKLRSRLTDIRDDEKMTQTVHYLGLPLRLNYSWLLRPKYTCYTAFGGIIERAVDAKIGDKSLDVHGIQCGLEGALGVQYKLTKQWGVFGEIGVSHYFDDDSHVETYRDEHATSLLLNFGLRLEF